MVFSAVSGNSAGASQISQSAIMEKPVSVQVQASEALSKEIAKDATKDAKNVNKGVVGYVDSYFSDLPIMKHVAWCESRNRQFAPDGEVFRGIVNDQDVGVMQINEHYHLDTASGANYNLYSVEGNTAYARKLYEKFGTAPWNSSKPCWGKYVGESNTSVIARADVK